MQLGLRYSGSEAGSVAGAFLKGSSPKEWLRDISLWGTGLADKAYFLMPAGLGSQEVAGLFIVFRQAAPDESLVKYPYAIVGGKLFIPFGAKLWPEVSEEELKKLLIWDFQVFHPVTGFTGFEGKDQVDLAQLVALPVPQKKNWNLAKPGLPTLPGIQEIRIEHPDPEQVLDELKSVVEKKPLEDIAKEDKKRNPLQKAADAISLWALKKALSVAKNIGKTPLPKYAGSGASHGQSGTSGSVGIFEKLQDWLAEQVEDLEVRRLSEINRLLKLFDNNLDEALQYAIPLDNPYLNRGTAPQRSQLSRHSLNFNLRSLGGGKAVDSWDLGDNYFRLRTNYLNAAAKEKENKNFKKAAYIYAHLLGDFNSAANVLEQGGFYREAAAIYQKHLRNLPAAASCMERGGLLPEAIEVYIELNQLEKVGDLYAGLNQPAKARIYFNRTKEQALQAKDYLEAARLLRHKLQEPQEAKEVLLQGWQTSVQSEACLQHYFEQVTEAEKEKLAAYLQEIYHQHTPVTKKTSLLNVLTSLVQKTDDTVFKAMSRDIAYEVVSEQVSFGNTASVQLLRNFVSDDRLLASDSFRYIHSSKIASSPETSTSSFKLSGDITWLYADYTLDQMLLVGSITNVMYLARCNSDGHYEYQSWPLSKAAGKYVQLLIDPVNPNQVFVSGTSVPLLEKRILQNNSHFLQELQVQSVHFSASQFSAVSFNGSSGFSMVQNRHNGPVLISYSREGALQNTCLLTTSEGEPYMVDASMSPTEMVFRNGSLYVGLGTDLLCISESGQVTALGFTSTIRKISATPPNSVLRFAVSTDEGCTLVRAKGSKMEITSDYFARSIIPQHINFIPASLLVVVDASKAILFNVLNDEPVKLSELKTYSPIIGVLPAAKRNACAVIERTGKITVHSFD